MSDGSIERAPAKLNLVLRVGAPRADGLHPLCSLFARLTLADEVRVAPAGEDVVRCDGVEGPNLAERAVESMRELAGPDSLPPLRVDIEKVVPVAAGLGGGSADAAAVLRAAARIAGIGPADPGLAERALALGSDVPSQLDPAHAIVTGIGEGVERVQIATMGVVLIPDRDGLSTAAVYRELDRLRDGAPPPAGALDPQPLREIAALPPAELARHLANDLQPAALALRPDLTERIDALRSSGALGAAISGSGPTAYGLFEDAASARAAAETLPGAIATEIA